RALMKDLDGGRGRANLHQIMHKVVRHAVEVGIESHVIVDVDAGARPLAQIERFHRQRLQYRFIESFEYTRAASLPLAEWPVIQFSEQLTNGSVEFIEREKPVVSERRHDPAIGHLYGVFDLGFVAWLIRARR